MEELHLEEIGCLGKDRTERVAPSSSHVPGLGWQPRAPLPLLTGCRGRFPAMGMWHRDGGVGWGGESNPVFHEVEMLMKLLPIMKGWRP